MDLDPGSPIPLYHQIADALRRRIEEGELVPGAALEPLREAAVRLGVNVHTVRHAYAELAREGLVESRRALGTRVRGRTRRAAGSGERDGLEEVVRGACARLGLTPAELHERLGRWLGAGPSARPAVHVVECSQAQCEDLAAQLDGRWDVAAAPWPLSREGEPAEGAIVATFFHYNEIRTRWPERLHQVRFLTIRPDPELPRRLGGARGRRTTVVLCELDAPTLEAVAADLSVVLPPERYRIETRLVGDPAEGLRPRERTPVLFTPRTWSLLPEEQRGHPRAVHLRYVFDGDELERLGAELGLRPGIPQSA